MAPESMRPASFALVPALPLHPAKHTRIGMLIPAVLDKTDLRFVTESPDLSTG
jgi:hypothetical protein